MTQIKIQKYNVESRRSSASEHGDYGEDQNQADPITTQIAIRRMHDQSDLKIPSDAVGKRALKSLQCPLQMLKHGESIFSEPAHAINMQLADAR